MGIEEHAEVPCFGRVGDFVIVEETPDLFFIAQVVDVGAYHVLPTGGRSNAFMGQKPASTAEHLSKSPIDCRS
jgi:hypothetical protein